MPPVSGMCHAQDIQLHFVELKDCRHSCGLAEVGLTTREACAKNTVRNVTACHLAGICQEKCST